jgi:Laminin EGF domain
MEPLTALLHVEPVPWHTPHLQGRSPVTCSSTLSSSTLSSRRRLLASVDEFTLSPSSALVSTGALAGYYITTGLSLAEQPQESPSLLVTGTADNGVCETGEPSGSTDCIEPVECPEPIASPGSIFLGSPGLVCAGNGACNRADGSCVCAQGYAGNACDRCDEDAGYADVRVSDDMSVCSKLASDFAPASEPPAQPTATPKPPAPARDRGPTPNPPPPAQHRDPDEPHLSGGAVTGIVVGSVAGVALIAGGAYYAVRSKGAKNIGPV